MPKILLVEDDDALARSIQDVLEFEHHDVVAVADGAQGLEHLLSDSYDLAILDRQLPGLSGTEIAQGYRKKGGACPILMLTGLDSLNDKVEGLDSGADDYLTKPFAIPELIARVKALMRRQAASYIGDNMVAGEIRLETQSRRVTCGGEELRLKPLEYSVLEYFMRHPDKVISAEELLRRVWSSETDASIDSVYTSINRLRKKLGSHGEQVLQTVHGVGYKLVTK